MIDVKQLAEQAGIETDLWQMGAGSLVYSKHCDGIPRAEFEHFVALVLERAAQTMPSTPEEISAFIGSNFCGVEYADPDMPAASQGDTYTLTAHDLLSAFDEWEAIRALKPKE